MLKRGNIIKALDLQIPHVNDSQQCTKSVIYSRTRLVTSSFFEHLRNIPLLLLLHILNNLSILLKNHISTKYYYI